MKLKYITLIAVVSLIMYACTPTKIGEVKSCINVGNTQFKLADSIYFMNCSEYYARTKWTVKDSDNIIIYYTPIDTIKHFKYKFSYPGRYSVDLKVWFNDTTIYNTSTQDFTISL